MTIRTQHKVSYFGADTSLIVKGCMLVLMFVHHFFTFPSWILDSVHHANYDFLAALLCSPTKICVAVFAFLTGYSYFLSKKHTFLYSLKKVLSLFTAYWMVFIPVYLLAVFIFDYHFSVQGFLIELFALKNTVLPFCWYVLFYAVSMLYLPLIYRLLSKNLVLSIIFGAFLPVVICQMSLRFTLPAEIADLLSRFQSYFPILYLGFLCSQYSVFDKLDSIITKILRKKFLIVIGLAVFLVAVFFSSNILYGSSSPSVLSQLISKAVYTVSIPFFVFSLVYIIKFFSGKVIGSLLTAIGKKSMFMWFLHGIFFNFLSAYTQPILYFPYVPILILIWGLFMCYCLAVPFSYCHQLLLLTHNKK